jgi:fucose permease
LASSALSPLIGTPKAIAVGIAITIVGSLLMIQFSVAKYFGFTTKE